MLHQDQSQDFTDKENFLLKSAVRNSRAKKVDSPSDFHQRIVPAEKIYRRKRLNVRDFDTSDEE
jgi:hypothetical protein